MAPVAAGAGGKSLLSFCRGGRGNGLQKLQQQQQQRNLLRSAPPRNFSQQKLHPQQRGSLLEQQQQQGIPRPQQQQQQHGSVCSSMVAAGKGASPSCGIPLQRVWQLSNAPRGARGYANTGVGKPFPAAPSPLLKNVEMKEILSPRWVLEPPNYLRRPLWRQWWEAQFANRSFLFFGNAWTSAAAFAGFLWWSRIFDPPPKERLDRYWLNSPKFRILSAFHNPGKRPALKISLMTYEARYCYRGLDHPFTLNELKDFLFKLREQHLVSYFQGVQFPFVFRQFNRVKTPGVLEVHTSPVPQQLPHFHEQHGEGEHH